MNAVDQVKQTFGEKATAAQVEDLYRLIIHTNLSIGEEIAWKKKAGVERFSDMSGELVQKCIDFLKRRLTDDK